MSHQLVIDVTRDTLFVHRESLHRQLHSIERSRFPNEIGREVVRTFGRDSIGTSEF